MSAILMCILSSASRGRASTETAVALISSLSSGTTKRYYHEMPSATRPYAEEAHHLLSNYGLAASAFDGQARRWLLPTEGRRLLSAADQPRPHRAVPPIMKEA